jgi:hypothetical protein
MAVDLISRARERRERLLTELSRIDAFLAMASQLEREFGPQPRSSRQAGDATRHSGRRGSLGAETVAAAIQILSDRSSLSTRDLLPLITARGIEIGGKSPIATLSARLSAAKGSTLELVGGKWRLIERDEIPDTRQDEPADSPLTGKSADSLFNRQTNGGTYAATLA